MTDQPGSDTPQPKTSPRSARWALALAALALLATGALWLRAPGQAAAQRARAEDAVQKLQRRLNALEDRIEREHDDLGRLAVRVGAEDKAEDSLTGRVVRLEDAIARLPGAERVRFVWLLDQAEYFMRVANAQENLAGDTAGALAALTIADEYLRDAADPRLAAVRKRVAGEIAALRAVPQVDVEGLVLKLGTLDDAVDRLPLRQTAPPRFNAAAAQTPPASDGVDRALQALRRAFTAIVSVRRTNAPAATLLTEEAAGLLGRSVDLELQMARLALLRGEAAIFRDSLGRVRRDLEQYFDTGSAEGASALVLVDELARTPLPESLPDISVSLTELVRVKERELAP
jgi:uroporphyrin-3 C-methyltransferase